jgi:hypothetical protein
MDEAVDVVQSLYSDEAIVSDSKIFNKKTTRANHIQPNVI